MSKTAWKHIQSQRDYTKVEWNNYQDFMKDMGQPPDADAIHITRIKADAGYIKGNVIWSTSKEIARNRPECVLIDLENKRYSPNGKSLAHWCEKLNLDYPVVQRRLQRGWSIAKAFSTPTRHPYRGTDRRTFVNPDSNESAES